MSGDGTPAGFSNIEAGHGDLCQQYGGQIHQVDETLAMHLLGCTDTGMQHWAVGFRYDSAEAFGALKAANWDSYGHETLGPVTGPDGFLYGLLIPYRRDGISPLEAMIRFRDQAHSTDTSAVAALLGRRDLGDIPAKGFRYDTREAFGMLAAVNRDAYGHKVLGPAEADDGKLYGLVVFGDPATVAPWEGEAEPEVWRCAELLSPAARVPDER